MRHKQTTKTNTMTLAALNHQEANVLTQIASITKELNAEPNLRTWGHDLRESKERQLATLNAQYDTIHDEKLTIELFGE